MEEEEPPIPLQLPAPPIRRRSREPSTVQQIGIRQTIENVIDKFLYKSRHREGSEIETDNAVPPSFNEVPNDINNFSNRRDTDTLSEATSSVEQTRSRSSSAPIPQFRNGAAVPNSVVRGGSSLSNNLTDYDSQSRIFSEGSVLDKLLHSMVPNPEMRFNDKQHARIHRALKRRQLLEEESLHLLSNDVEHYDRNEMVARGPSVQISKQFIRANDFKIDSTNSVHKDTEPITEYQNNSNLSLKDAINNQTDEYKSSVSESRVEEQNTRDSNTEETLKTDARNGSIGWSKEIVFDGVSKSSLQASYSTQDDTFTKDKTVSRNTIWSLELELKELKGSSIVKLSDLYNSRELNLFDAQILTGSSIIEIEEEFSSNIRKKKSGTKVEDVLPKRKKLANHGKTELKVTNKKFESPNVQDKKKLVQKSLKRKQKEDGSVQHKIQILPLGLQSGFSELKNKGRSSIGSSIPMQQSNPAKRRKSSTTKGLIAEKV